jgi:hypothetical protein
MNPDIARSRERRPPVREIEEAWLSQLDIEAWESVAEFLRAYARDTWGYVEGEGEAWVFYHARRAFWRNFCKCILS